jgi:uncharacterized protein (DUF58 family)
MTSSAQQTPESILRRLDWTITRRLDGLLQGDWRSVFRGAGMDLADLREYQHHDDVRHIDWNVTARIQTPYVREYHEDREVTVWFLLDLSPSMDFGSGGQNKRAQLVNFVALMSRLFTHSGNRVGAMIYATKVERVIQPRGGRRHLLHLIDTIQKHPVLPVAPPTQLADLISAANTANKRRSVFFVVSDFISQPGWEKPLGMLAQRHEVTAIRLVDPLEQELPDTGEQVTVDTNDNGFRKRFEAYSVAQEESLASSLIGAGVDVLELATNDDLLDTMIRFIEMRRLQTGVGASAMPEHLAVNE